MIETHPNVELIIAAKRGKIKALPEGKLKELKKALEKTKAQIRAFVEHPCHIVQNLFYHRKARHRELAKNEAQPHTPFTLANLLIAKRSLLAGAR